MSYLNAIKSELSENETKGLLRTLLSIYLSPSKHAMVLYRIAKILYDKNHLLLSKLLTRRLILKYGLHLSLKAEIGKGLKIKHMNGIVIGDGVKIGDNVTIYQQVTLGGKNIGDMDKNNYPIVGNNVTIFSGAKILGNITIGENSIIGANSVVIRDVDSNSVYAGIPARKIKPIDL